MIRWVKGNYEADLVGRRARNLYFPHPLECQDVSLPASQRVQSAGRGPDPARGRLLLSVVGERHGGLEA